MKKLFCIIIILLTFGCNSVKQNSIKLFKGKAIVVGKVQNYTDSSEVLQFSNSSVINDINQITILDSLGNFRVEFELFNPQDIGLHYENSLVTLYLHPGDSLYLNIDANLFKKDTYPYYEVSGKKSTTSKNIRDYLKSYIPFNNDPKYEPKYDKPFNEFLDDLKLYLAVEDSVLQEFYEQNKPTEEFMSWAKNDILYFSFSRFINYSIYNRNYHKEDIAEIFNTNFFPCDDSAIVNSGYIWFLSQYPIHKYSAADSVALQLLAKNDIKNSFSRTLDNIIRNEKPGLSRDIMIYKIFDKLYGGISGLSVESEDIIALFEKYKTYINSKELVSVLEINESNLDKPTNVKETIVDLQLKAKSDTIVKLWKTLEKKHKDKVIYIDVWATWCGPCRSDILHAGNLYNYYKDKPIVFVNLCLGNDRVEWEKLTANIREMSDNYFFNDDESKLLTEDLNVGEFPTHIIINRKGELINKNVPTLASGKNMLNKLINE